METIIILALAVFLLSTSAGQDPRMAGRKTSRDVNSPKVQTQHHYQRGGGYKQIYSGQLQNFIRKFQPEMQKSKVEIIANSIIRNGKIYNIDPKLIAALIARESSFDPKAKSKTGALGLGQIKPFNFTSLGISDPYNPEQNIKGIAIMLKDLMDKWSSHKETVKMALASYTEGYYGVKKNRGYTAKTKLYIDGILKYQSEI